MAAGVRSRCVLVLRAPLVDLRDTIHHLHMAQIIKRGLMAGDEDILIFKLGFQFWHPLAVPLRRQHHAVDDVRAKGQQRGFCQIAAVTGGVKRCTNQGRNAGQDVHHHLLLLGIRQVAQLHAKHLTFCQGFGDFQQHKAGEVTGAGKVFPEAEAGTGI